MHREAQLVRDKKTKTDALSHYILHIDMLYVIY